MTFSDKIKRAREMAQLTQRELAQQIGVSQRAVAAYETDGAVARRTTMMKLAKALKVSFKYLSDENCTDSLEEIEKDSYVREAEDRYGSVGARDVDRLLSANTALFAGGELSQEQKDAFFQAVMTAYVTCREEAKAKFGKKTPNDIQ